MECKIPVNPHETGVVSQFESEVESRKEIILVFLRLCDSASLRLIGKFPENSTQLL